MQVHALKLILTLSNRASFRGLRSFWDTMYNDKYCYVDLLWKCVKHFDESCSIWSGVMQALFGQAEAIRVTTIVFLPCIDLRPTDMSCVYSTLKFIERKVKDHLKVPVCTFDEALWWTTLQVLSSPKIEINCFVIRLGGKHIL